MMTGLRLKRLLSGFLLIVSVLLMTSGVSGASGWQTSPGNAAAHRHFAGSQITAETVGTFSPLWRFDSGQRIDLDTVQSTPVFTGKFVVTVTIAGDVIALDPANAEVIWRVSLPVPLGRRGITFHTDASGLESLFVPSAEGIYRLDANTGGTLGLIRSGLSLLQPIPIGDRLYVATLRDGIKAFDLTTGDEVWHRPLDKGGVNVRVWSGFSADAVNDLLLVTTSNPGGLVDAGREAEDFSVSIIAIDAGSGAVIWQYQHIRNDVWDLDLVSNPIIVHDLPVQPGKMTEDVVIGLSKTGEILVLRLSDGKPLFPDAIQKSPTASATQDPGAPVTLQNRAVWPRPVADTVVDLDRDFSRHRGAAADYMRAKLRHARSGWLLPTSPDYDVVIYGLHGGPEWPGASVVTTGDRTDLVVPFNRNPWILRVHYADRHFNDWQGRMEPFDDAAAGISDLGSWIARCWYRPFSCGDADAARSSRDLTRWSHDDWRGSDQNGALTGLIYPRLPGAASHDAYQDQCATCHGVGRQGAYQSEFFGDGYVPPLVGFTLTDKWLAADTFEKVQATHRAFGVPLFMDAAEYLQMMAHFDDRDRDALANGRLMKRGFWQLLLDADGLPASNPPWGRITSLNLNSGEHNWTVPFGTRKPGNGKADIRGDINFGGLLTTAGGILFATGTPDRMVRAFDTATGQMLWEHQLPYAGSAPPMGFHFRGCDVIIVKATGGRFVGFDGTGDSTLAFKSDDCVFE